MVPISPALNTSRIVLSIATFDVLNKLFQEPIYFVLVRTSIWLCYRYRHRFLPVLYQGTFRARKNVVRMERKTAPLEWSLTIYSCRPAPQTSCISPAASTTALPACSSSPYRRGGGNGRRRCATRGLRPPDAASYQRTEPFSMTSCPAGASSLAASRRAASTPSENDCHRPEVRRQPRR